MFGQAPSVPIDSPEHRVMQDYHDRAIKDYDETIRLDPQDARAYYSRGNAYGKLGQTERANQDFDEAIRLNPSLKRP